MIKEYIKYTSVTVVLILAFVVQSFGEAKPLPPHKEVEARANALVTSLTSLTDEQRKDPDTYENIVKDIMVPVIDFNRLTRNIMGREYYKAATKEQRKSFTKVFKESLITTYSVALSLFDRQEINVLEPKEGDVSEKKAKVRVEIKTAEGMVVPIQFSMRKNKKTGVWKVSNVILNGVNVGLAFRNHFSDSMAKHGNDLDKVVANWNSNITSSVATKTDSNADGEQYDEIQMKMRENVKKCGKAICKDPS